MGSIQFNSNGKFLLTGEYLVLKGARCLAIPLRFGQSLRVNQLSTKPNTLRWKTFVDYKFWFYAEFSPDNFDIIHASDDKKALFLKKLLQEAHKLNPTKIETDAGILATSEIDFNIDWGLGSSSTLISNIAQWFGVDPMELHFKTSTGSGYDVACAGSKGPIHYKLANKSPEINIVPFDPPFKSHLYFIYLGKKQVSSQSIRHFGQQLNSREKEVEQISEITETISKTKTLDDFEVLLDNHEDIMSEVLGTAKVKEKYFSDFNGSIKSLGAWGGDFILATWRNDPAKLESYFKNKGLNTIFRWDDIVYKSHI